MLLVKEINIFLLSRLKNIFFWVINKSNLSIFIVNIFYLLKTPISSNKFSVNAYEDNWDY